ncbi:MarR family winged helix-turn-helix transcriptional regulator [Mucilaginibacter sp. X5P1]|uniref:MarR family winged helix-turn-helix transcriptional regulator n=1 Tax=Mucilaginibacter sp. X5P1 TaxID=2723088 RepID=UPI00160C0E3E|nr:MarR family winged helix-turn-helix transcriptional regulator [Mucilaginibacter sp. X5P1]MBB6139496.1 DNA-binding MarR family transcriptional regulator [Mucilaginibacter sp. X5P1]
MTHKNDLPVPPILVAQIGRLYNNMYKGCDKNFREHGFPLEMDQVPVLLSLYYTGGVSQQAICSNLRRDKASVNRTISFLVKNDIAIVIRDTVDKRKTCVKLTAKGENLAMQGDTIIEKYNTALASGLTEEERKEFNKIMLKLIGVIDPM